MLKPKKKRGKKLGKTKMVVWWFDVTNKIKILNSLISEFRINQGYRNRYDINIIDHGHEKKPFMYIFHRPIFTEIREFTTIVL